MKKQIRLLMLSLMSIILLGGCNIFGKQANIKLSAEYEALCNSKNTKNKQLCRETMNQLPKFENDVNAYFKEKFGIGDFVLTGINFPYGSFDHGGFNATFQLKSDRYVMITDTFDYKDGKYMIRAATNEDKDVAGQTLLATAILDAEFVKTLPISEIENDMKKLNIQTNQQRELYYGLGGSYFQEHNLVNKTAYFDGDNRINKEDRIKIINNYQNKISVIIFFELYKQIFIKNNKLVPLTYVSSIDEIREIHTKYIDYIEMHPEYSELLSRRIVFYLNSDVSTEKFITINKGEVKIDEL